MPLKYIFLEAQSSEHYKEENMNFTELEQQFESLKQIAQEIMKSYNQIIQDTTMNETQKQSRFIAVGMVTLRWQNSVDSFTKTASDMFDTALYTDVGTSCKLYGMVSVLTFLLQHITALSKEAS